VAPRTPIRSAPPELPVTAELIFEVFSWLGLLLVLMLRPLAYAIEFGYWRKSPEPEVFFSQRCEDYVALGKMSFCFEDPLSAALPADWVTLVVPDCVWL